MKYKNEKKRKGRPPHVGLKEGAKIVTVRFALEMQQKINEWRRGQPDIPGFSESLRRLIEKGLEHG